MNQQTTTPKSLRLQIGIFGRTNVGKSSFLNMIAGQDVSITSPVAGTTTDVVEKVMELLPVGPVLFLDTGGLDDISVLASERVRTTKKVYDRSDIFVLVIEPRVWTAFEDAVLAEAVRRTVPVLVVINKTDLATPGEPVLSILSDNKQPYIAVDCTARENRDRYINAFKSRLIELCPDEVINTPSLIGDLVPPGGIAVLVVPIDLEAPKGRLILPQVQTIRDALDNDAVVMVVKDREYVAALQLLKRPPAIVIGDSQVVLKMVADTPKEVTCTTFSIVFSRSRGDLTESARGAAQLHRLKPGDKVLIAEACSHHAVEDDIGRVKIPRWIRQYCGIDLVFDTASGSDYPENLSEYALVIHCGGCMINRRHMLSRIQKAREAGVPITNYGLCISLVQGVLDRVLEPFPSALIAYQNAKNGL
ncbi:MAG: [FeFe] hydrogenase H-cluster maturation GTPase HydF [Elusimicrobia bacterium]|nr:[FeFe] hydrogenase H-cluster maturation GTPase HydF [Elusimicrobiota bacterium]